MSHSWFQDLDILPVIMWMLRPGVFGGTPEWNGFVLRHLRTKNTQQEAWISKHAGVEVV